LEAGEIKFRKEERNSKKGIVRKGMIICIITGISKYVKNNSFSSPYKFPEAENIKRNGKKQNSRAASKLT
jgi:hypothetical protein